jgi:ribA/ribD-fused uncharacterized protein
MSERQRHGILAFYSGVFSNWHPCEFRNNRGIVFVSTEQYMMYRKAEIFGDKTTAALIMATNSPNRHKSLGRKVANFSEKKWKANRCKVMIRGLYYKFSQNPLLAQRLLATGDDLLVEASTSDDIWGVKMGLDDPKIFDTSAHRGLNLLGKCLMRVRKMLRHAGIQRTEVLEKIDK